MVIISFMITINCIYVTNINSTDMFITSKRKAKRFLYR